jgi:hypothetical protein
MRDTVELLEAIGRDAKLRHASPEELAKALEANNASVGLRELVVNGDGTTLTDELSLVQMHVEHQSQTAGHEGDGHDDDHRHDKDDGKEDEPKPRPDDTDNETPST